MLENPCEAGDGQDRHEPGELIRPSKEDRNEKGTSIQAVWLAEPRAVAWTPLLWPGRGGLRIVSVRGPRI